MGFKARRPAPRPVPTPRLRRALRLALARFAADGPHAGSRWRVFELDRHDAAAVLHGIRRAPPVLKPDEVAIWLIRVRGYGVIEFIGTEAKAEEMRAHKARWERGIAHKFFVAHANADARRGVVDPGTGGR